MSHYFDDLLRDANGKYFTTYFLGHVGQDDLWVPAPTYHDPLKFNIIANPKKNLVSITYLYRPARQNVPKTSLENRLVV